MVKIAIVTDDEILLFCNADSGWFEVTSANDVLVLTSDQGGPCSIDIADGTYNGSDLATALQTAMNADSTLTGGTITFAVSYSTSTRKLTLDATSGHTIAFTMSGSDAGITCGFSADASAAQTITSDMPAGDPTTIITEIRDRIEAWVQNSHCYRTFESTSHTDMYNGTGGEYLFLNNWPVTDVTRVAVGRRNAIKITNTSTTGNATVGVTSTGLVLTKDGTADSTVLFATYDTMTKVVDAVNALGSNWSAALMLTDYASYLSTDLIERFGAYCNDSHYAYLEMPDEAEDEFRLYPDQGKIQFYAGFPAGHQNVFVDFTAGYSAANMPDDLKLAVEILTKHIWDKRDQSAFGVLRYSMAGLSAEFATDMPHEAKAILSNYKRIKV